MRLGELLGCKATDESGGEVKKGETRTKFGEAMNKNEFTQPMAAAPGQSLTTGEVGGIVESGCEEKHGSDRRNKHFRHAIGDQGKGAVNTVPGTCSLDSVACNRLPR